MKSGKLSPMLVTLLLALAGTLSGLAYVLLTDETAIVNNNGMLFAVGGIVLVALIGLVMIRETRKQLAEQASQNERNQAAILQLLDEIADLAEGEWLQMENATKKDLSYADIQEVALKKTGSVLRWCCLIPAIISDQDPKVQQLSRRFGEHLGMAFQISDDILDFTRGDGSQHADIKNGVITSVIFYAYQQRSPKRHHIDIRSISQQKLTPQEIEKGITCCRAKLGEIIGKAHSTLKEISQNLQIADNSLSSKALTTLSSLTTYLQIRV